MTAADDLRDTLLICREQLDKIDAHPIYLARLGIVERIIRWTFQQEEYAKYWGDTIRREEHKVDLMLQQKERR